MAAPEETDAHKIVLQQHILPLGRQNLARLQHAIRDSDSAAERDDDATDECIDDGSQSTTEQQENEKEDSDISRSKTSINAGHVVCHSVAVQTQTDPESDLPYVNVISDDNNLGFDENVRVLRAIGTWAPNYAGSTQFLEDGVERFISPASNGSIEPTPTAANSSSNPSSRLASSSNPIAQATVTKSETGVKSFTCPVCNKGLARKDKLIIHMRIHTGEKPYVCEVCDRAFARRDKLVMHMNKLKHLTPNNAAPLGKRQNPTPLNASSVIAEKRVDVKTSEERHRSGIPSPVPSVEVQPATLVQVIHEEPAMTWSCELCGRLCTSREEWSAHARSHLSGDGAFGSTSVSSSLSVLTPLSTYQFTSASTEHYTCLVCRQEFSDKSDYVIHMRAHFVGKPELLAGHVAGLVDNQGICS